MRVGSQAESLTREAPESTGLGNLEADTQVFSQLPNMNKCYTDQAINECSLLFQEVIFKDT